MKGKLTMDKNLVHIAFNELTEAIKKSDKYSYLDPSEFILMSENIEGSIPFKNKFTRNYIFVNDGMLEVPQTDEPFMRGEF